MTDIPGMDPQCLSKVQARFHLDLHPSKLYDVNEGVNEHLNSILFKYQDDLEGFVMAYNGAKILSRDAAIHPYFPLVHVEVQARVLLFKPTVGCMLIGRVIKIAADFVGLLVLGVFNASVAADSIRSDLKLNVWDQCLVSKKHPEHEITVGTEVRFRVVKLQETAAFFGIFGSMLDKTSTGSVKFLRKEGRLASSDKKDDQEPGQANGVPEKKSKKKSPVLVEQDKQAPKEDKKTPERAGAQKKAEPAALKGQVASNDGEGSTKKRATPADGERKKKKSRT